MNRFTQMDLMIRTNVVNAAGIAILHLNEGKVAEAVRSWEWEQKGTDMARDRNSDEDHTQACCTNVE